MCRNLSWSSDCFDRVQVIADRQIALIACKWSLIVIDCRPSIVAIIRDPTEFSLKKSFPGYELRENVENTLATKIDLTLS